MQYYIVNDWNILAGAMVEIRMGRDFLREGVVESYTPDGCIVWLEQGQGFGRQLVDKGSGFNICISEDRLRAIGRIP
ncbi:hypothetical protein ABIE18_002177 [Arthrobacter sp. 2762]